VPQDRTLLLALLRDPARAADAPRDAWPDLVAVARREHLAPLLHAALDGTAGPSGAVPHAVRAVLARDAARAAASGARAYVELAGVLNALGAAGVRAALLKGVALARFTYGDPAMRPFGDLDLLIRPGDERAAVDALQRQGYVPTAPGRGGHEQCCIDPSWRRLPVDLHVDYAEAFHGVRVDHATVFARATEITVDGASALLPSPEDTLLCLAVQFVRELWDCRPRLRYLCDVGAVLAHHPVDWDYVLDTAREHGWPRAPLSLTLGAAVRALTLPVPADRLAALRAPRGALLERALVARVARTLLRRPSPMETLWWIGTMAWADDVPPGRYPSLIRARLKVQWARVTHRWTRRRDGRAGGRAARRRRA